MVDNKFKLTEAEAKALVFKEFLYGDEEQFTEEFGQTVINVIRKIREGN